MKISLELFQFNLDIKADSIRHDTTTKGLSSLYVTEGPDGDQGETVYPVKKKLFLKASVTSFEQLTSIF